MTQEHLIIELFCRVDNLMPNLKFDEHSIFHLSLAEFTYDFASTNSYFEINNKKKNTIFAIIVFAKN